MHFYFTFFTYTSFILPRTAFAKPYQNLLTLFNILYRYDMLLYMVLFLSINVFTYLDICLLVSQHVLYQLSLTLIVVLFSFVCVCVCVCVYYVCMYVYVLCVHVCMYMYVYIYIYIYIYITRICFCFFCIPCMQMTK